MSAFWRDLWDRSAKPSMKTVQIPDIWAGTLLVFSSVAAFVQGAQNLITDFFRLPYFIIPFLLAIFVFSWCVHIITAKTEEKIDNTIQLVDRSPGLIFSYGQPIRQLAKVGLLVILILTPFSVHSAIIQVKPLPETVYGYLYSAKTGEPIVGARVRAITNKNADITKMCFPSDSRGFYILETAGTLNRRGYLLASVDGCDSEIKLSLEKEHELSAKPHVAGANFAYRHVISCERNK